MTLGPHRLLFDHNPIKKPIRGPGRQRAVLADLRLAAALLDDAQVAADGHVDSGFLPGLARGGVGFRRFVGFPAALGQHPAFARGGLDQEDLRAVGGERDDAGDEAFAGGAVAVEERVNGLFEGWGSGGVAVCTVGCRGRRGRALTARVGARAPAPWWAGRWV